MYNQPCVLITEQIVTNTFANTASIIAKRINKLLNEDRKNNTQEPTSQW